MKDPIADVKGKEMKSPWDFTAPEYDERSSCYVNAGTHHGVGYKQPVGHMGNPATKSAVLPKGRAETMRTDEVPRKNLRPEFQD